MTSPEPGLISTLFSSYAIFIYPLRPSIIVIITSSQSLFTSSTLSSLLHLYFFFTYSLARYDYKEIIDQQRLQMLPLTIACIEI